MGKNWIGFGHHGGAQMIEPGGYPKRETILLYTHIQSHDVQTEETHTKACAVLIDLYFIKQPASGLSEVIKLDYNTAVKVSFQ